MLVFIRQTFRCFSGSRRHGKETRIEGLSKENSLTKSNKSKITWRTPSHHSSHSLNIGLLGSQTFEASLSKMFRHSNISHPNFSGRWLVEKIYKDWPRYIPGGEYLQQGLFSISPCVSTARPKCSIPRKLVTPNPAKKKGRRWSLVVIRLIFAQVPWPDVSESARNCPKLHWPEFLI